MPALAPSNGGMQAQRAPILDSLTTRDSTTPFASDDTFASFGIKTKSLESRQIVQGLIPTYLRQDGPGTGAVVGITLGSVAGFLLLVWLLWTLTNNSRNAISGEEEIVVRKRARRNSNSHRSRRGTRSEVREYERSPRRSGGRSTVIVEERTRSRPRSIVVEETRRRVPGDDMVEVIEEDSEYETRRTRRGSGYR